MNFFRYLCKGCGVLYHDMREEGAIRLVHRGLTSSRDRADLPSTKCIPYHDYVVFEPCGHCCPEVFPICRACKLRLPGWQDPPGRPMSTACFCHYCVPDAKSPTLTPAEAEGLVEEKTGQGEFDVFLCNSSVDRRQVEGIGSELKRRGVRPWLDTWEIRPGQRWLRVLQEQIIAIKTAAVFVGPTREAPFQRLEVEALLEGFVTRGSPVIPTILRGGSKRKLPLFLRGAQWVDFNRDHRRAIDDLVWGITGLRPETA